MELFKAHQQWKNRPADERYQDLQALYEACKGYTSAAREKAVAWSELRVENQDQEVVLNGRANVPATFTHWAFGQLCARLEAPASYMRTLPATLAVQNLNYGLNRRTAASGEQAKLMFHQNGSLVLRALTSIQYERIWNWEVAERLLELQGWVPATPDFNSFGADKQTALYASDHDMFAFLRSETRDVKEEGTNTPLYRGVIVENSEVGAGALKLTRFLYRAMCGNFIIWQASKVVDLSIRHIGDARKRWAQFAVKVRQWSDESTSDEQAIIGKAKRQVIAGTKEQVLDAIFGKRSVGLSRKTIEAGYEAVVPDQDGDPKTVWGLVQGLTRHSQTFKHADSRMEIDRRAGKILECEF